MSPSRVLELIQDQELRRYTAGEVVIEEGSDTGAVYFLVEGTVEVIKGGVRVARASEPGAVFGEVAVLLGGQHRATVRATTPCAFRIVARPRALLAASPEVCLHVCEVLARRLDALNRYLVDVRRQFAGHDHLGMLDQLLETLLTRQPQSRVRPSDSTVHHGEGTD